MSCLSCLYMLNFNHLSNIWFPNIFSHSVGCPLFCWFSFVFVWCRLTWLYLLLLLCFWCHIQKLIAQTSVKKLSSMFSSSSFSASGLMFKSLIHFELIFVYCEIRVPFHSSTCGYPVFPTPLVGETILSLLGVLGTLVKVPPTVNVGIYFWTVLFHWFMCRFLCQHHTVLIIADLSYILK